MTAPAAAVTPLPAGARERVFAWGGATAVESWVARPRTVEEIRASFALARVHGLTIGLRGGGQSYGDAALNGDGLTLDLSRMNRILAWDRDTGVVRVEPGVTVRELWQHTIVDGWWPTVVPGTMYASLGGAVATNIHGKNNWKVGPIGEHVLDFELLLPSGEVERCSPEENAELFHAAIGGFGMLGCITSVRLRLKEVSSGLLAVEALSVPSLEAMMEVFERRHAHADYLVGWVDCFARGRALGRGLVHQANHLAPGEDRESGRTLTVAAQELPPRLFGVLPRSRVWLAMRPFTNPIGVPLVNAVRHHVGRRSHGARYRQPHAQFAFLLDSVPGWKRAYGPGGLIQYQSFIPTAEAARTFSTMLARAQAAGEVPLLGVLKRHRTDAFLLTHAVNGYSLALDFRITWRNRGRVWALAAELDRLVVDAGGRFYLAKDSTLRRETYRRALGAERERRFAALKRTCDPEGLLQTDLARRLFG
jgi:decaprenylphospho-beta-D-ribofuranose 2-oxidase